MMDALTCCGCGQRLYSPDPEGEPVEMIHLTPEGCELLWLAGYEVGADLSMADWWMTDGLDVPAWFGRRSRRMWWLVDCACVRGAG